MLTLKNNQKRVIAHLVNLLLLSLIAYYSYKYQQNIILEKNNDVIIYRDLIQLKYWAVVLIILLIYLVYFITFNLIYISDSILLKSLILGIECFLLFWMLLSLYSTFNFVNLINDPIKRIPFITFTGVGFLLPVTYSLLRKTVTGKV